MKTMRYIAIIIAVLSVLSVRAQRYAQPPQVQMYSTSAMISSGSTLPSAAATGTVLTGNTIGEYNPASAPGGGPRKIGGSGSGTGGNEAEERDDPYKDPIGDGMIPLALCALAYLGVRVFLKRKRALSR